MPEDSFLYNTDFLRAIRKNKRNCALLVIFLILIMAVLGYLLGFFIEAQIMPHGYQSYYDQPYQLNSAYPGYPQDQQVISLFELSNMGLNFAFIAILLSLIWVGVSIFLGGRIILSSANAREVSINDPDYAMFNNVIQEVSIAAGISPPKAYIIETEALNAFATGFSPENSAVAITRGLLTKLNRDELQGVIAHEIGHIINYDIRYQTMVSSMVGMIILLSDIARRMVFYHSLERDEYNYRSNNRNSNSNSNSNGLAAIAGICLFVFSIIAPIAALILQMTVSREREYMADATSVKLTRNPSGLISALRKLENDSVSDTAQFAGASHANQNLFIVNPFKRVARIKNSLFATHPRIELRIERLKNLGG